MAGFTRPTKSRGGVGRVPTRRQKAAQKPRDDEPMTTSGTKSVYSLTVGFTRPTKSRSGVGRVPTRRYGNGQQIEG
jgi:hypothetical protein